MTGIEAWSTTDSANNATPPNGAPEGMAPSTVNNTIRHVMAVVRAHAEDSGWLNLGHTHVYVGATSAKVSGVDVSAYYTKGRRVRAEGVLTGTIYGRVASVAFSTDTTMTYEWDATGSLSNEALTISVSVSGANQPWSADLTGAVNTAKGVAVASGATTDIWAANGNLLHVTGTTTITSFGTAPQAGAERFVIFDSAITITRDGTAIETMTGASLTLAAGSAARIVADTTTKAIVYPYIQEASQLWAAKAWGKIAADGTVTAGYNVASVTVLGTGVFTLNFTTPFANINYAVVGMPRNTNNEFVEQHETTEPTVSAFTLRITDRAGGAVSTPFFFVAFGAQ